MSAKRSKEDRIKAAYAQMHITHLSLMDMAGEEEIAQMEESKNAQEEKRVAELHRTEIQCRVVVALIALAVLMLVRMIN